MLCCILSCSDPQREHQKTTLNNLIYSKCFAGCRTIKLIFSLYVCSASGQVGLVSAGYSLKLCSRPLALKKETHIPFWQRCGQVAAGSNMLTDLKSAKSQVTWRCCLPTWIIQWVSSGGPYVLVTHCMINGPHHIVFGRKLRWTSICWRFFDGV